MLRRYVEQILNIYNYIDGLVVTDKYGYIEYYKTFRPDVNNLKEKDLLGKYILDIYPTLSEETSSVMRVLKTGKPITNEYQTLITYKGQSIRAVNTTMPIKDNDEIIGVVDVSRYIDSPFERQKIALSIKENKATKNLYSTDDIITNSLSMELVKEKIRMIADTDSSVLIYGKTGTGKELVAQSIHTSSKRKNKKFVSQNCAAIPAVLLESILFGTTKGSFTGAENKPGLFEIANGGTLFLDEINSMEIGVQSKILKAIEEKKIVRLGGYEPIKTDIKIVSAVNENPLKCIKDGKLREDLFYRLSVVQITIPPLKERKNDLFLLISHFINEFNKTMKKEIIGIDEDVEQIFKYYTWPGNVRELRNVIEGAFNVSASRFIQKRDLPEYLINFTRTINSPMDSLFKIHATNDIDCSLTEAVSNYERKLITKAVENSNSLTEAAKVLGVTKQALNYKINKYNINR